MPSAETMVRATLLLVAAGYGGAAVLLFLRRARLGVAVFAASWVLNAMVWLSNGIACGQPPFGNMHHVLAFVAICFLPVWALLRLRHGLGWTGPYFALAAVFAAIGAAIMEPGLNWRRVPALQSPWFIPHVTAYMLSYALAAVAFLLTVEGLFRRWWRRRTSREAAAEPSAAAAPPKPCARASYVVLRVGFPFMTFGMLSGALWAEEAWGVYWSWDPKETWSLITWVLYLIYFHCRRHKVLRPCAQWAQVVAFAALLITFLAVNLLPKLSSVLHSYT